MKTIRVSTLILTTAILATGLFAQTLSHSHHHAAHKPGAMAGMPDDKMMADCKAMMQKHDQMMTDFKTQDATLDDLVTKVKTSAETEKVEALTAVVGELVVQHKSQRDKMTSMHAEMMQHMMEHMQTGKQPMSMCPMMRGMSMPKSGGKGGMKM